MSNQIQGFQLSPQQTRLWLLQQVRQVDPVQCAIMLEGDFNTDKLNEVLQRITDRHEILRTTFHHRPGIRLPIQVIADRSIAAIRTVDLEHQESLDEATYTDSLLQQEREHRFNYEQGPLLRALLLSFSTRRKMLLLTLPAVCADARTLGNIFSELCDGFAQSAAPDEDNDEPTQYVQFSEWQNQLSESEESKAGKDYWRRLSEDAPGPSLLGLDKNSTQGSEFNPTRFCSTIDGAIIARIEAITTNSGTTVSNFLLCCWQTLLWRLRGQSNIRVAVRFDGREFEELHGAMGVFSKRLPLDCLCHGTSQFQEVLRSISESVADASSWQDYFPVEESYETNGDGPTLSTGFEFEEWPATRNVDGLVMSLVRRLDCAERYEVKLQCQRRGPGLELEWHYDGGRLSAREVERLAQQYATLVASACQRPEATLAELAVVSEGEREELVVAWNRTERQYADASLPELFEAQVERSPAALAVQYEGARLSYAELDKRANQVAHYLQGQGIGAEAVVGILLERSLELVVCLLGVLKAGAAYLPLDASYPEARLRYMLADGGVQLLLTEEWLLERVGVVECGVLCVSKEAAQLGQQSEARPERRLSSENLAYVIYTSGSSGRPKGVMITHGGLVNYLNWCTKAYSVTEGPGTLVNTSIGFDLTITSLFSPLMVGQSVTILPEEMAIDGLSLALAGDSDFSLIKITPGHLDILSQWFAGKDAAVRVHAVVIGGEALHWSSLSFWQTRLPDLRLINEYGPTECVVGCCVYEVPANASGLGVVPIGRPIANTQIYLLDSYLEPVPSGATGELYVGGEGLARGYLNSPALTAEKFIANPFSDKSGMRLYKTGDLARFLPSDELEFLGRVDTQVKIRGFRIELGELEYTLKEHPWVADAVVTVREDVPGDVRLIAYCVTHQPRPTASDELQSFLKEKLPHYMIPAAFVILSTFPLTINGKVDRAALPAPELYHAKSEMSYAQPRTEVERTIVGLWQEMLRLKRVGIYDNFFDLGGHSMLMVQLHSRLRSNLNRDIPIIDLFGHPTISSLAEFLSQQDNGATPFQAGRERADTRRTSTKRQKQIRQDHRRPLGLREG